MHSLSKADGANWQSFEQPLEFLRKIFAPASRGNHPSHEPQQDFLLQGNDILAVGNRSTRWDGKLTSLSTAFLPAHSNINMGSWGSPELHARISNESEFDFP
jgi:hypothetical protein